MPPYFIDYYCPRIDPLAWKRWGSGFFNRSGKSFLDLGEAQHTADSLIWQFHRARVVDSSGAVYYQV